MIIGGKVDLSRSGPATEHGYNQSRRHAKAPGWQTLSEKKSPRVMLLQGPVGPFFKQLQSDLERNGFDAWRVTFNAGDRLFSSQKKRLSYRGGIQQWSEWLSNVLKSSRVDHLIIFGCARAIHREAVHLARGLGINILSLEEGYIRPGFITVEEGGNNRLSPIAGQLPPDDYSEPLDLKGVENFKSFKIMCLYGCLYYIVRNSFTSFTHRKLFHKQRPLITEAFYWTRNAYRRLINTPHNFSIVQELLEHQDGKYFVLPLQVSDDMQLLDASCGWSNEKLILSAISSFARSAPNTHRLVFKVHPLERGHSNHRELIHRTAEENGIARRVDVIDAGSLGLLVRHSAGMLTINSTSGLSAIAHGVPLFVIGDALYSNPALAHCGLGSGEFDEFWRSEFVADPRLRRLYLHWIREKCLAIGDFYSAKGRELASRAIVSKLQLFHNDPSDCSIRICRVNAADITATPIMPP